MEGMLVHNHPHQRSSLLLRGQVSNAVKRKAVDQIDESPSKLISEAKQEFNVTGLTKRDIQYVSRVVHRARSKRRDASTKLDDQNKVGT